MRHHPTVRGSVLFNLAGMLLGTGAGACSGGGTTSPPPRLPLPPVASLFPPDAPLPPQVISHDRGSRCAADNPCAAGLACAPLAGGYCTSSCGVTGGPCDGACVETGRQGELCMKACAHDADCRVDEGYTCDPVWHACALPNLAAIVPRTCAAPPGPAQDTAFSASEPWSSRATPGMYQLEPTATLDAKGEPAALYITNGANDQANVLAFATRAKADPFTSEREHNFDPWLAHDRAGKLFAAWLAFDGSGGHAAIELATSKDSGTTWSTPAAIQEALACEGEAEPCADKPMLAIGPDPVRRGGEILYAMYASDAIGLRVRASRDGGATFGAGATALAGTYGNATVGADGRLHIVAINGGPLGGYGSAQQRIEYTVSSDGGVTFAKPLVVSGRDEMLPFFFANPSVAVDTARKWLYFAYVRGGRDARWSS